jgi:hypothetical protein
MVDRRPGVTTSRWSSAACRAATSAGRGRDGWHDGLLMELLAGEERSHAAALCRQALASSGPAGRAACHGAHVKAAERWMAPGRWDWTGGGRDRLIGAPVLKPRETAVKRR